MTLHLLLAPQPLEGKTVIFADPSAPEEPGAGESPDGGSVEFVLAGLVSQLEVQHVMFPLPDQTTWRHVAPPSLMRERHTDLWHALSADERTRVLLAAGPTAAYLAPVPGGEMTTLVALGDPRGGVPPRQGAWRFVLGPFPELDEIPEEAGSEEERDRWLARIRAATSELELVRATDLGDVTMEVAAGVGLGPEAASNAAAVATSAGTDSGRSRHRDRPPHWLDEALYSLGRPPKKQGRRRTAQASTPGGDRPKRQRPRKRRRRNAGASTTADSPQKQARPRKRRRT